MDKVVWPFDRTFSVRCLCNCHETNCALRAHNDNGISLYMDHSKRKRDTHLLYMQAYFYFSTRRDHEVPTHVNNLFSRLELSPLVAFKCASGRTMEALFAQTAGEICLNFINNFTFSRINFCLQNLFKLFLL